jgi:hypothetical protein
VDHLRTHPSDGQPYNVVQTQITWDRLPTEIVLEILGNLSIRDVLSFTSCCRMFHMGFGNKAFLSSLLRGQLRRPLSSIYWFMPVNTVMGEVERFDEACKNSITLNSDGKNEPSLPDLALCFTYEFPLYDFVRTNYRTESMRNRRRLWRISQQFRHEWYRYRTEGYEYNVYELGLPSRTRVLSN